MTGSIRSVWAMGSAMICLGLLSMGASRAQGVADNPAYSTPIGPIPIRDPGPYNLIFLQFAPETADVLRAGRSRFGLQLDLINNLLIPDPGQGATVVEDNEYQRLMFSWRRGLGRELELGVSTSLLWRNGGILDGLLTFYHHLAGLPADAEDDPLGRDHWPEYRSRLQIIDAQGHILVDQGNAFGLGETQITLKRSLIRTTSRSALAVRLGVKLPTGNPTLLLGSGSVDAGLSLDARYCVGRDVSFYANLGGVLMGPAARLPGAQSEMAQGMAGIEYRPNHRDSFVLQIDANGLPIRTGNSFADQAGVTATFGYQRVLDRHLILFASYSENGDIHDYTLPAFSNIGPDVTFSFGLSWLR